MRYLVIGGSQRKNQVIGVRDIPTGRCPGGTRRRGPSTVIPRTRPCASTNAPPSAAGLSVRSRRKKLSIVPPRLLRQDPVANATMPKAARAAAVMISYGKDGLARAKRRPRGLRCR